MCASPVFDNRENINLYIQALASCSFYSIIIRLFNLEFIENLEQSRGAAIEINLEAVRVGKLQTGKIFA